MSILIAEDNEISTAILESNLRDHGYATIVAHTGPEALELLKSNPGVELVITDINMPVLDGLGVLQKIRENPAWSKIPVILCTAMGGADMVRRAAMLGCRHYLIKPIQRWTLIQKVAEALGDQRPVLMDREAVMQKFGLDAASYDRIFALFKLLVTEQIGLLDKKINNPGGSPTIIDLPKLVEEASVLGAERLAKVAERLQMEKTAQSILSGNQYVPLFVELKTVAEKMNLQPSSCAVAT